MKTTTRTLRDFPEVAAAERRRDELQTQWNTARAETAAAVDALANASSGDDATEAHVGALLSGAATLATLTLDATKGLAQQVAEKERMERLARLAFERKEVEVARLHAEASNRILQERKPEFIARLRAIVLSELARARAWETDRAFREELDREGVRGALTAFGFPTFYIEPFNGSVTEPDSYLWRLMRDAEGTGALTAKECAQIRAGGTPPSV